MFFKPESGDFPQEAWTKEQMIADAKQRDGGNMGAMTVLGQLIEEGPETYSLIAPKLGTGAEVWDRFKEAGRTIQGLIERTKASMLSPDKE